MAKRKAAKPKVRTKASKARGSAAAARLMQHQMAELAGELSDLQKRMKSKSAKRKAAKNR
jgi:hypothetical protein